MRTRFFAAIALLLLACVVVPPPSHAEDTRKKPNISRPLDESLIYHAYFGKAKDIQRLLKKGADPNARDRHHWPALAIASDRTDDEAMPIARLLVDAGADVNAASKRNYPLINAIINNNAPLVALLVTHDVNLRVTDPKGVGALTLARQAKNPNIAYYMEKRIQEEKQTRAYLTSSVHLRQIMERFAFNNCAYQYWVFYLKSKQDKNVDEAAIQKIILDHARLANDAGVEASRYFPEIYQTQIEEVTTLSRGWIYHQLNEMISNRNRRSHGVGTPADMVPRCREISDRVRSQKGYN